jgi:hypothetical protein
LLVRKNKDQFEKSLRFVFVGFLAFFWVTSFRGHAEPHWTVLGSLPLLVLVYRESVANERLYRYLKRFVMPSLLLVLIARVLLVSGLLPERLGFDGKKEKYEAFESVAGDAPVIFGGSFQGPSLYRFFTGKEATVISAVESRKTQFDVWKFESLYVGRRVFIPSGYPGRSEVFKVNGFEFNGFFTDSLQVTNHIKIETVLMPAFIRVNDTLHLKLKVKNEGNQVFQFNHSVFPAVIKPVFIDEKGKRIEADVVDIKMDNTIMPHQQKEIELKCVYYGEIAGEFDFAVLLHSFFGHTLNSGLYPVTIK